MSRTDHERPMNLPQFSVFIEYDDSPLYQFMDGQMPKPFEGRVGDIFPLHGLCQSRGPQCGIFWSLFSMGHRRRMNRPLPENLSRHLDEVLAEADRAGDLVRWLEPEELQEALSRDRLSRGETCLCLEILAGSWRYLVSLVGADRVRVIYKFKAEPQDGC